MKTPRLHVEVQPNWTMEREDQGAYRSTEERVSETRVRARSTMNRQIWIVHSWIGTLSGLTTLDIDWELYVEGGMRVGTSMDIFDLYNARMYIVKHSRCGIELLRWLIQDQLPTLM